MHDICILFDISVRLSTVLKRTFLVRNCKEWFQFKIYLACEILYPLHLHVLKELSRTLIALVKNSDPLDLMVSHHSASLFTLLGCGLSRSGTLAWLWGHPTSSTLATYKRIAISSQQELWKRTGSPSSSCKVLRLKEGVCSYDCRTLVEKQFFFFIMWSYSLSRRFTWITRPSINHQCYLPACVLAYQRRCLCVSQ